jgi:hypothetical protein
MVATIVGSTVATTATTTPLFLVELRRFSKKVDHL